jgi:hypothetical protein
MTDIERQISELTMKMAELRSQQLQMNSDMVLLQRRLEDLKTAVNPTLGRKQ